jgi:hypothetical protein
MWAPVRGYDGRTMTQGGLQAACGSDESQMLCGGYTMLAAAPGEMSAPSYLFRSTAQSITPAMFRDL